MGVPLRSRARVAAEMAERPFQGIHKSQGGFVRTFAEIEVDSILDILHRLDARDYWLSFHFTARLRTVSRRPSK